MEILKEILNSPVMVAFITGLVSLGGNFVINKKDFIRNQILTLIIDDQQNNCRDNYQAICLLYDKYTKLNGNSYIKNRVERYLRWVEKFDEEG